METWITQIMVLTMSVIFSLASLYMIYVSKPKVKWIYISFFLGHFGGVIFYCAILCFDATGHNLSSILRLFQTMSFGTWLLSAAFSKAMSRVKEKNLKTRMDKCLLKLSQYSSQSD